MNDRNTLLDYVLTLPQYLLPHHWISRIAWHATRRRHRTWKNFLIDTFIRHFDVDMSIAEQPDAHAYPTFNHFFTRALNAGARPIASGGAEIACPADGTISQLGEIRNGRVFQAKGHDYGLVDLLGGSEERAAPFQDGSFITVYLSPRDYHRVHLPRSGTLREMVHVPGRLFSVNRRTTHMIPQLFTRNERIVCCFDTATGPMAIVMVGAINVGSIETVWAGEITPPSCSHIQHWSYADEHGICFDRGEEMARFNMGSTVIVLFAPKRVAWEERLEPDSTVCMGERIGICNA